MPAPEMSQEIREGCSQLQVAENLAGVGNLTDGDALAF
jgi:hypothetical protein